MNVKFNEFLRAIVFFFKKFNIYMLLFKQKMLFCNVFTRQLITVIIVYTLFYAIYIYDFNVHSREFFNNHVSYEYYSIQIIIYPFYRIIYKFFFFFDLILTFPDNHIYDIFLKNSFINILYFIKFNFYTNSSLILKSMLFFYKLQTSKLFLFNYPVFFFFGIFFFFSTFFSLFFLSYLGLYGVFFINLITLFLFWISTFFCAFDIFYLNKSYKINLGKWFYLTNDLKVNFDFFIDSLSISYMLLTLTISLLVQIYTFSYFRYEPLVERLVIFLNMFIISMVFLVSSGNTIMLFLGWELIGLTSFVLINFWVTRKATLKSAFKAFTFNKFSDVCFFIFVILMLVGFHDTDINSINSQVHLYYYYTFSFLSNDISFIEVICFFILGASLIKSAQFGGHLWLPDSMEAPVPASSLIHSATLVSAGLFLLLRFNVFFELSSYVYYLIPFFGSVTAFYGGLCAAYQSDTKRILAYSTISHCGFLFVSFSSFLTDYTILYLYIHGFFKAGVFLCVGNVIRFSGNYQDFKKMGGFYKYLPFECVFMGVGLFNLAGLPFSLGFYMKHLFFVSFPNYQYFYWLNFVFISLGALSGLFYSYRLYYYTFFDLKKAKKCIYINSFKKKILSKYYSNTTLASNIAIFGIFFFAYVISFIIIFFLKSIYTTNLNINVIENSQYSDWINSNYNFLWNISYFNWLVVMCFNFLVFSFWRKQINYAYSLNLSVDFVVYSIFLFIFIVVLQFNLI